MRLRQPDWIERHPVTAFLIATFVWSWMLWIPGVMIYLRSEEKSFTPFIIALALIGAYGPSVSALGITRWTKGRGEAIALLRRLLDWRIGARWYMVVLLLCPVALLLAMAIAGGLGHFDPAAVPNLLLAIPIVLLTALPFGPLAEELGWRGFLLPHLQLRFTPVFSSMIIGLIWAVWHLPLWWVPGAALPTWTKLGLGAIGLWGIYVLAISVLFTWVYNNTHGSILIAVLLHTMTNATGRIILPLFPGQPDDFYAHVDTMRTGVIVVFAVMVALAFRAERHQPRTTTANSTADPT